MRKRDVPACALPSFLRAISTAFSSFVIPAVLWTDPGEATGDDARSLGAGDANGVVREHTRVAQHLRKGSAQVLRLMLMLKWGRSQAKM